ncbi:unnamed protein product [Adineta steineri]|uniref:Uncharacterized protein n=1 Tax=Adineta steineri TaxID=433720 RepID=A0A819J3D7_9BILA|nr:unnamed protein product [Adineta steineri]CAF3927147.1 unnamed protein product [Adineta steineri]
MNNNRIGVDNSGTITSNATQPKKLFWFNENLLSSLLVQSKPKYNKWQPIGITVAGRNGHGDQSNQLHFPNGIYTDDNSTIVISENANHRIVEWKYNSKRGQTIAGGQGFGSGLNQLHFPLGVTVDKRKNAIIICDSGNYRVVRWFRQSQTSPQIRISNIDCWGVAIDKDGSIYVSNWMKNEVRRLKEGDTFGAIVAGGNGKGNLRNQLHSPADIFVDKDYSVYVSDSQNHRIMKWKKNAKEGIVVAGGNSEGNHLNQLHSPHGVIVDNLGQIIIADSQNHRIMLWCEGDTNGSIAVGENGKGKESNQLNDPRSLSFDVERNLYVADSHNHRVQKYELCNE